jgi:hypothetical protein
MHALADGIEEAQDSHAASGVMVHITMGSPRISLAASLSHMGIALPLAVLADTAACRHAPALAGMRRSCAIIDATAH